MNVPQEKKAGAEESLNKAWKPSEAHGRLFHRGQLAALHHQKQKRKVTLVVAEGIMVRHKEALSKRDDYGGSKIMTKGG